MSKTSSQFAFANNFSSDNLKRLKDLVRLGVEYRKLKGAPKTTVNADMGIINKLNDVKRIKMTNDAEG